MPTAFDITPTVTQYSALPHERVRIVKRFEELPVTEIRRGVVYLLAAWSGPSVMFFRRITELIGCLESMLEFFVVDIDCVPADFFSTTFARHAPTGAGETLWVRDGVVVASVGTYAPADVDVVFLKHTRELLDSGKG
jgi:hypothetical protein